MSTATSPSRELRDLSITAMLGTDRASQEGTTSASLLARAAVVGVRARAGRRCGAVAQPIATCPTESRPSASVSQAAILDRLLASPDAALIEEWCVLAVTRGVRVPAASVPMLLEWWSRQPSRSPEVFEATGACGAWLARLNPDWSKPVTLAAVPADADERWQTGSGPERAALLATVRSADPSRALALVRMTWTDDGADERRRFVEALEAGISARDEEFLEAALDDRGKMVRREAARVLTRLPGSAMRTRMRQRAAAMIAIERTKVGLLRRSKVTIKIEPPKTFDKSWERDGVEDQAFAGKGKRASWMSQILAATDLATWTELAGLAPPDLLELITADEYFDDVLRAMLTSIAACPEQPDADTWSDALLDACTNRKGIGEEQTAVLWRAQSESRSEAMRLRMSASSGAAKGAAAWRLLTSDPRAWSREFSKAAMKVLQSATPTKTDTWEFWSPIEEVSKLLHPAAADEFEKLIATMYPDGPSDSIRKSLDRVRLRAEMHREFSS